MMHSPAESLARREIERQIIEDGTAIWKSKKDIDNQLAFEERRQSHIQNFFSEGAENNSDFDFSDHKEQLREMLATYHPWGKPGNGAPMPGALRKTKWITEEPPSIEHTPTSAMTLGRPGHGAPLRTKSGKTKTVIKADPSIRFQFHESSRKSVDNDLRYRASPSDKENYRKQLDALVYEKKRAKSQENGGAQRIEKNKKSYQKDLTPWGRPGPGGKAWRDPKNLGHNFLKSLGWTNDVMLRRLEKELPQCNNEQEQVYEISGGGVELVPLLARHRMVNRCPLSTTDVTRMSKVPNGPPKPPMTEHEYYHELCHQVHERHHMEEEARREDLVSSQKHFETWKGFWGRPGHGAPKGMSQREKLEVILYHIPSQNVCPGMQNMIH